MSKGCGGIYIFAYGSLMWRPDFPYVEAYPALLRGYRRALCIYSVVYRGVPERPGLVMGLDRGGSCKGRAFLVAPHDAKAVLRKLDERELVNDVYERKSLKAILDDGRTVETQTYVARPNHRQYTGKLTPNRMAQIVLQGHGKGGSSLDYLKNTLSHMKDLGIKDGLLQEVLERAEG